MRCHENGSPRDATEKAVGEDMVRRAGKRRFP